MMRATLIVGALLLAVGCGEAAPQAGVDAGRQDTASPPSGSCAGLNEAACTAAGSPCEPLMLNLASRTASDGSRCYVDEGVPGAMAFAVCLDGPAEGQGGTGDVVCAVQPETGEFFHFWSGSLVPAGWQRCAEVARPCPPPLECADGEVEEMVCLECGPTGGCSQQMTACRGTCTSNGDCTSVEACFDGRCSSGCR
jgi:hypothetical protein